MYLIRDLQEPPEADNPHLVETIENITERWQQGAVADSLYHSQLALLHSSLKHADETRKHAALVGDTADDHLRTDALIALARIMIYEKDIDEAINIYRQALEIDPEHETVLEELGWCYYEKKQYGDALPCFVGALNEMDYAHWLCEACGLTLSQLKRYTDAINYFTKAIELDEDGASHALYNYYIGVCYEEMKDFYRALAFYFKSLDADPTFGESLNNIAALYYEHEADVKTAIEYLRLAEAIAEERGDTALLQLVCINMIRLHRRILDYDTEAHYKNKLMSALGFPVDEEEE